MVPDTFEIRFDIIMVFKVWNKDTYTFEKLRPFNK